MCPSQAQNVFTVADRDTNGTLDPSELSDMRRAILRMEPELLKHPLTPAFADKALQINELGEYGANMARKLAATEDGKKLYAEFLQEGAA